jgi:hypothetical protein
MVSVYVLVCPLHTIINEISAQIVASLHTDLIAEYLNFSLNFG